jgi:hypothetical protein
MDQSPNKPELFDLTAADRTDLLDRLARCDLSGGPSAGTADYGKQLVGGDINSGEMLRWGAAGDKLGEGVFVFRRQYQDEGEASPAPSPWLTLTLTKKQLRYRVAPPEMRATLNAALPKLQARREAAQIAAAATAGARDHRNANTAGGPRPATETPATTPRAGRRL